MREYGGGDIKIILVESGIRDMILVMLVLYDLGLIVCGLGGRRVLLVWRVLINVYFNYLIYERIYFELYYSEFDVF